MISRLGSMKNAQNPRPAKQRRITTPAIRILFFHAGGMLEAPAPSGLRSSRNRKRSKPSRTATAITNGIVISHSHDEVSTHLRKQVGRSVNPVVERLVHPLTRVVLTR